MREHLGDLFEMEDVDVRCILTNGSLTKAGLNIMGAGVAGAAARQHPWLPMYHGHLIAEHGVQVYLTPGRMLMFPTMETIESMATIERVGQSIEETEWLADIYGWKNIALPRPGAGLGGLVWDEIKDWIEGEIDDRFIIVHKEGTPTRLSFREVAEVMDVEDGPQWS